MRGPMPQAQKDHLSALGKARAKRQREKGLAAITRNRLEQKEMSKGKTQQVLEHLRKAAQLLAELEENIPAKHFSNAIESLVAVGQYGPQGNMVCSMLYAARESVEMQPALKRYTRDEVLEAARDITGKDIRDLDRGPYEISEGGKEKLAHVMRQDIRDRIEVEREARFKTPIEQVSAPSEQVPADPQTDG